jgi:hypothetical protein
MPYDLSACGLVTVSDFLVQDSQTTGNGVVLRNGDRPLITRGWDCFTSGNKAGIGRWGLFMEAGETFLAAPGGDYTGARIGLGGYLADGTKQDTLTVMTCARRVGIGACTPEAPLHIRCDSSSQAAFLRIITCNNNAGRRVDINAGAGIEYIIPDGTSQSPYFQVEGGSVPAGGGSFRIRTGVLGAAADRLAVTQGGCVGIGTLTPTSRLEVCGVDGRIQSRVDSSDGSTINVRPNAGKCGWISYTEDAVADRWGVGIKNGDAKLYFASGNVGSGGGTTRMVLDGSGNMGLGTVAPGTNLEVNGTDAEMMVHNQSNSRGGFRAFCNQRLGILTTDCSDSLVFGFENGHKGVFTERMRICNVTGRVGIGTSTASYLLHVNGTFYAAGSSIDYKQGICQYDTDSCMFMKLKPVTYQYKEEYKHLGKELKSETQIGLIAEEVAETYPELAILVKENDNDVVRNVDYEKLSIVLLAEVQKLRKEVDDLKTK